MLPSSPYLRASLVNEATSCPPAQAGRLMDETVRLLRNSQLTYHEAVREFQRRWIEQELEACGDNQVHAARVLGMHRNTLSRTMGELKIIRPHHVGRRKGLSRKRDEARAGVESPAQMDHSSECHSSVGTAQGAGGANSVRKGGRGESPEQSATAPTAHLASAHVVADKFTAPAASVEAPAAPVRSAGKPQLGLAAGAEISRDCGGLS